MRAPGHWAILIFCEQCEFNDLQPVRSAGEADFFLCFGKELASTLCE
jgi:hypothetical protein